MEHLLTEPTFWVAIGFVLFVVAVFKPAAGAITGGLDGRAARIEQELNRAVQLREEAEALLATYQRQAEEAQAAAEKMIAQANADAETYAQQMEAELKASIEKRRQLAEAKIAQAEARAVQDVQQHVADLALNTARELIAQRLAGSGADDVLRIATNELQRKLH